MPQIIIRSYALQVRHPYAAGQTLGVAEAQLLNALRAKNLHRSFAPQLHAVEDSTKDGVLSLEQLAELQRQFSKLDLSYQLQGKYEGAGPKVSLLDKEARSIALERARQLCQQQGQEGTQPTLEELAAKLQGTRAVQQEAMLRLASRRELEAQGLEALL